MKQIRREAEDVKRFYDSFGWQKNEQGQYQDTTAFVDTRSVCDWYTQATRARVGRFFARGKYLLDAGCGPILQRSIVNSPAITLYEQHACVDISITALKAARSKLQSKGWYSLADITHLPFRDAVFDAIVASHVLYHIHKEDQCLVLRELCRSLASKGVCVIIYTQFTSLVHLIPAPLRRALGNINFLKGNRHGDGRQNGKGRPSLYGYAHDPGWFRKTLPPGHNIEIRSLRTVDADFTRRYIPDNRIGRFVMRLIFLLETLFPYALARVGYQMIIIHKV